MDTKKYGSWALVTGASRGMGAEFARQLADRGFNIVLAARKKHLLESLATELEEKHNIKTRVIIVDLSETEAADAIIEATNDIQVGLLINNAMMMMAGAFVKHDLNDEINMLNVNITTPLRLTHYFGTQMRERGSGGIIFVASIAGYNSMPYMANYIAAKSYLVSFGEALYHEFKKEGVDILVLSPGLTDTDPHNTHEPIVGIQERDRTTKDRGMAVTPVVADTLENLGRKISVIPGMKYKIMAFIFKHFLTRARVSNLFGSMGIKEISKDML